MCCKEKLAVILREGVYITQNLGSITKFSSQSHMQMHAASPSQTVGLIQSHFESLESLSSNLMARAGVASSRHEAASTDTPWKSVDAAWFKKNPKRYHRLRRAIEGELDSIPKDITQADVPEGYQLDIVIRQISPGQRARFPV